MFSYALVFYFQNHWIQYIQYYVYCLRNVTLVPNIAEFRCLVSLLQAFMNEHMQWAVNKFRSFYNSNVEEMQAPLQLNPAFYMIFYL